MVNYPYTIKFYVGENHYSRIQFHTAEQFKENLANEFMHVISANDTDAIACHYDAYEIFLETIDEIEFEEDMTAYADEHDTHFASQWDEDYSKSEWNNPVY